MNRSQWHANWDKWLDGFLNSYSQVFFSDNRWLACFLVVVSFFDPMAGIAGALAVLIANGAALLMGYNKWFVHKGFYGYNALLVGLGFGLTFQPGWAFYLLLVAAALLTFFFTIGIQGVFYKYGLPYLSIPFLAGIWLIMMASAQFSALGLSARGVYINNELYALGGLPLIDLFNWFDQLVVIEAVRTYFFSLGAIFFQYNLLAGLVIAVGLLIYSRIAFSLSVLGFVLAWFFYQVTGADLAQLGYSYIGFNYILTSIALGGFFMVPSRASYLWLLLLLPMVIVITLGLQKLFVQLGLGLYALPFNIMVLTFLYVLKIRVKPGKRLVETPVQLFSPEKNVYQSRTNASRFLSAEYTPIGLPVLGEWVVNQAYDGPHTHKGEWGHALDFVMLGQQGKQFKGEGLAVHDYYCYDKPVVAVADGVVADLTDGVPDNFIGDANTRQNWGNTVVLKHQDTLYTQVSHLKPGSISVRKGDFVKKGDVLALCGNSGRSPYPHLHFQVQDTPHIGSKTLNYPLSNFLVKKEQGYVLRTHAVPDQDDTVMAIQTHTLLESAFHWLPGRKLVFEVNGTGRRWLDGCHEWLVMTDEYNNSYIQCQRSGATAWFYNNGEIHYFVNFLGSRKSLLYYLYLGAYRVLLGHFENLVVEDTLPANQVYKGLPLFAQDFTAPFYLFLQAGYRMKTNRFTDDFYEASAELEANVSRGTDTAITIVFELNTTGITQLRVVSDNLNVTARCLE